MSRSSKNQKFIYFVPQKKGFCKNNILIGINHSYVGDKKKIYLQDLLDFSEEKKINLAAVKIGGSLFNAMFAYAPAGGLEDISLQDFLDFLKAKNVDFTKAKISENFLINSEYEYSS